MMRYMMRRNEQTYSPSEVALILGVHVNTVRRWINEGRLQAFKTPGGREWRIEQSSLDLVKDLWGDPSKVALMRELASKPEAAQKWFGAIEKLKELRGEE